jgi:hypothetical protein
MLAGAKLTAANAEYSNDNPRQRFANMILGE